RRAGRRHRAVADRRAWVLNLQRFGGDCQRFGRAGRARSRAARVYDRPARRRRVLARGTPWTSWCRKRTRLAADGRTLVSADSPDPAPRSLTMSGPGVIPRTMFLRVPGSDVDVDLIPASFDL